MLEPDDRIAQLYSQAEQQAEAVFKPTIPINRFFRNIFISETLFSHLVINFRRLPQPYCISSTVFKILFRLVSKSPPKNILIISSLSLFYNDTKNRYKSEPPKTSLNTTVRIKTLFILKIYF